MVEYIYEPGCLKLINIKEGGSPLHILNSISIQVIYTREWFSCSKVLLNNKKKFFKLPKNEYIYSNSKESLKTHDKYLKTIFVYNLMLYFKEYDSLYIKHHPNGTQFRYTLLNMVVNMVKVWFKYGPNFRVYYYSSEWVSAPYGAHYSDFQYSYFTN